ncbi:MAG: hypothetical protein ACPL3C_07345 [Pyrobaculum sp.]|jgi:hypothetical protein|uniref:hypothetical protein n=1 Tax=Pyrobaculum sp. TaxID=2004705 RepID=UPI003CBB8200
MSFAVIQGDSILETHIEKQHLMKILQLFKKAKEHINVKQFYISTGGEKYVGIVKDDLIVVIKVGEMPVGVALLEAEKILFNFLNKPKS